ncbi:MAG: hypothetical protein ABR555_00875 [Pyrinomonadaceae bacterium]
MWDELRRHLLTDRGGIRHTGGLSLEEAVVWNVGTSASMLTEKSQVALNHEGESTDATQRGGLPRSSDEAE